MKKKNCLAFNWLVRASQKSPKIVYLHDFCLVFSACTKQPKLEMNKISKTLCCLGPLLFITTNFMQNNRFKKKLQLSQNVVFLTNISKTSILYNIFVKIPSIVNIVTLGKNQFFQKFFLDMKDRASDKRVMGMQFIMQCLLCCYIPVYQCLFLQHIFRHFLSCSYVASITKDTLFVHNNCFWLSWTV